MNHFERFLLPVKFEINLDELEEKYFTLQQQFHPDKSSLHEVGDSILINESYKVLKDSFSRASYILQLNGINIERDETAPKPNISTLQEIMEIQENILNKKNKEHHNIIKNINSQLKLIFLNISQSLENQELDKTVQLLIRAKYLKKILQDLYQI
jgi:molecular chaperone HscB